MPNLHQNARIIHRCCGFRHKNRPAKSPRTGPKNPIQAENTGPAAVSEKNTRCSPAPDQTARSLDPHNANPTALQAWPLTKNTRPVALSWSVDTRIARSNQTPEQGPRARLHHPDLESNGGDHPVTVDTAESRLSRTTSLKEREKCRNPPNIRVKPIPGAQLRTQAKRAYSKFV